jgi:hypothetical protein
VKIESRAADDLEHFGGRRLLFQGLAQLIDPVPQLVQQAGVLDRDDRLVGKARDQLDLLVREERDLGSGDGDRPERDPVAPGSPLALSRA